MQLFDRQLSKRKGYLGGTHRTRCPRETLAHYGPMAARFGITRIANVTGLDTIGIPVYVAMRPNARSLTSSQGKGLRPDEAKVSALMEAIELWHAEHAALPLRLESQTRLAGEAAVADIDRLPLAPGASARTDVPMLWAKGFDLMSRQEMWVPHDCVTTNFVRGPGDLPTFRPSSNGLASGNHLLEAIAHGLSELLERDAVARWDTLSEQEQKQTQLDPDSIADARCNAVLSAIERAGLACGMWDATAPGGLPCYVAWVLADPALADWRLLGVYHGMGAHLSPEIALLRALTEAVQSRLTQICGVRDDIPPSQYQNHASTDDLARAWQLVSATPPGARFGRRADLSTDTFEDDVGKLTRLAAEQGATSVVVVDLTQASHGVPVCKVVAPGLDRHGAPGARSA